MWLGDHFEEDRESFMRETGHSNNVKPAVGLPATEEGDIHPADITDHVSMVLCFGGLSVVTLVVIEG